MIAILSASRRRLPMAATLLGLSAMLPAAGHAGERRLSPATFHVVLRPETDAGKKVVAIRIDERIATGGEAGRLSLTVPLRFIGMIPFATKISDVVAHDAKGPLALTAQDTTLPDGTEVRRWRSERPVNGATSLRYKLTLETADTRGPPYGAMAGSLGVSGNTSAVIVIPDGVRGGRNTLAWDLSGMVAGSRGVMTGGEGAITTRGSPETLLDRWLMAGRLQNGQERASNGFNAYTLGTPPFSVPATMISARSVYQALAEEFGYLGAPRYELLIRTLDQPSFVTGTAASAGGGALITSGSLTYVRGQADVDALNIIAHEMGHQWVGQFEGGGSLWFAEGLNVYVTSTLPCEVGLQPWKDCSQQISNWAKAYYGSEGRDWSQDRIEGAPFAREDLRQVSYGRGMMYFANLDAAIRARSGGKQTLVRRLRPLFDSRRAGQPITIQRWEAWLRAEQGEDEVRRFRDTVLGGALIEPSAGAFGPNLEVAPSRYADGGTSRAGYAWNPRTPQ